MKVEDVIKRIKVGEKNKITLYKASAKVYLWWEEKDKWFCNIESHKDTTSTWIIEPDLPGFLDFLYLRQGYKIKEEPKKPKNPKK